MGRPKKTPERPLISAVEAESMVKDLDTLKEMNGAGEMGEAGYSATAQIDDICVDKVAIQRKIDVLSRQLDSHKSQRVVDGRKRDELFSRRKWLEEKFKDFLETYRDINVVRRDSPDWNSAYQKAIRRPEIEPLISEWKRIGLMLEPQDPYINDLNKLRKDC